MTTSEGTKQMPKRLQPTPLRERMGYSGIEYPVNIPEVSREYPENIPTDRYAKQIRDQLQETAAQLHDVGNELLTTFDYLNSILSGHHQRIEKLERERIDDPRQWPELMSRKTSAAYLDVSPSTLDRLVAEGHVPTTTPRGMSERYYRKSDLDAFITEDGVPW